MRSQRITLVLVALLLAGCGSTPTTSERATAAPSPAPSSSAVAEPSPQELAAGTEPLPAGAYTRSGFEPPITFAVDDGWSVGSLATGFFDMQQQPGTPDVIAVLFANVDGVIGAGGGAVEATFAVDAIAAIKENPGLVTLDESASQLGDQSGVVVEVENRGAAHAPILDVPAGRLGIDPERRLWVALFDTRDGVLAVMVGGSAAGWEDALGVAEPVLESIIIGA